MSSSSQYLPTNPQQEYPEQIKATAKDTIEFQLKPAIDVKLKPWQSKVGGVPYYPLDLKYPCTTKGVPLTFLVQINFSETPRLEMFPEKGILEFFINVKDYCLGMDYQNPLNQDGFRVVYFDTIDEDELNLREDVMGCQSGGRVEHDRNPIKEHGSYSIDKFLAKKQYITSCDYHFKNIDCAELRKYRMKSLEGGNRLGGYPSFAQYDPRSDSNPFRDYVLLLQLDSDWSLEHNYVMWGDTGVGAFFIHPDDLRKCDFSKVLFNWDTY